MSSDNEPAKLLLPYLQRADELQKHEPLVAYYCRLYAMERGLKIPQSERTKTTNSLLVSLMKQLEKDKKSLELGPDDNLHVEGFALNVFAKADKQDRAGRADLNTAKTFYAASIFFEILNQFGELQPDLEQKQKYAAWKAADIRKALKEGRKPVPGPPGDETSELSSAQSDTYVSQPSATVPVIKHVEIDDVYDQHSSPAAPHVSPSLPATTTQPPPPPQVPSSPPTYHTEYSSHDLQPPPRPVNSSGTPSYPQTYHDQPYQQDPPYPLPQHQYPSHEPAYPNFQSHDIPSSYPNFQSYPSFTESSLPSAPSHYPSYYQGSENTHPSVPQSTTLNNAQNHTPHYSGNGSASEAAGTPKTYQYDSSYQPTPEKIAEAHKAARFAVGALAFDDVSIAVDYLKKSLELLTNPSAAH